MDDIIIIVDNKYEAHIIRRKINKYLKYKLNLEMKSNHCIKPLKNGIDFVGFVIYKHMTTLRTKTLIRIKRCINYRNMESLISYKGWVDCTTNSLIKNKLYKILI